MKKQRYLDLRDLINDDVLRLESAGLRKMVQHPYPEQENIDMYADSGDVSVFFDEEKNPQTDDSHTFRCLIARAQAGERITGEEMAGLSQEWVEKAESIWQIRGDHKVGFQAQQIVQEEGGKFYSNEVYELQEDGTVTKRVRASSQDIFRTSVMSYEDFKEYIAAQLDSALETTKGKTIDEPSVISMEEVVRNAVAFDVTREEVANSDRVERREVEKGERGAELNDD